MQDSYLGNNHDYVKFALLRRIHRKTGLSIGVNWYLNPTPPKGSDPKKTSNQQKNRKGSWAFLAKPCEWKFLDPELFNILGRLGNLGAEKRKIEHFRETEILPPDTCYFAEPITEDNRLEWHKRAKESCLKDANLIFLDPDTGFEPAKSRITLGHALYSEAVDWLKAGKHVVTYQNGLHCVPVERAKTVRERLHCYARARGVQATTEAPVILGRSNTAILLVAISPEGKATELNGALESFAREIYTFEDCKTGKRTHKQCKIKLVP